MALNLSTLHGKMIMACLCIVLSSCYGQDQKHDSLNVIARSGRPPAYDVFSSEYLKDQISQVVRAVYLTAISRTNI